MTDRRRDSLIYWLGLLPVCMGVVLAAGCAVGRNELDGSIVLGFKAGQLVETTNQAVAAAGELAGGLLPGPWGQLLALGATAFAAHSQGRHRGFDEALGTPPAPTTPGAKA